MNESQRAAALRLADDLQRFDGAERESLRDEAAAILRELLAEPVINQQMTTELAEPVQEPVAWRDQNNFDPGQGCTYSNVAAAKWPHIFSQPLYAAPQQRRPLVDDIVRPLIDDTSEVFCANGPETPQVVRDVIEYVQSWLEVYFDKRGITGEPT